MELNPIVWAIGSIGAICAVGTVVIGCWPEAKAKPEEPAMPLEQESWNHYQTYGEPK